MLPRRRALLGLTAMMVGGASSLAWAHAPTDRRFVVIILRGALDGMAAVVPYGDRNLLGLRGEIVPPQPNQPGGVLDLGGFFGLHPALAAVHQMVQAQQAAIVHAVAAHYRVRSHFEAQDCLESGADQRLTSGWLNRVVAALQADPSQHRPLGPDGEAVAIGVNVPLLLRGPSQVANWAPHGFGHPNDSLYAAVADLNRDDPVLGPAIRDGMAARGFSASVMTDDPQDKARFSFAALAKAAGEMLAVPNGPRIAGLEIGGWDTHTAQVNRLNGPLKQLDAGLVALKTALGAVWSKTVVLVMTEFGRTARVNGTKGTDHGTATVAFVLGGSVRGGAVLGGWPGLTENKLFENRDLAPMTDLRAVAKGILGPHLGLSAAAMSQVFPGSDGVSGMGGLIQT